MSSADLEVDFRLLLNEDILGDAIVAVFRFFLTDGVSLSRALRLEVVTRTIVLFLGSGFKSGVSDADDILHVPTR
jgi:hypothetical protein